MNTRINFKMEYECWLCNEKIKTNDLFATINIHIQNSGDIIDTVLEKKICSWCASRPNYWKEIAKKQLVKERKDLIKHRIKKKNKNG